ncbi:hypothetical protein C0J52_10829, partial [Blattella germanica]
QNFRILTFPCYVQCDLFVLALTAVSKVRSVYLYFKENFTLNSWLKSGSLKRPNSEDSKSCKVLKNPMIV